MIKANTPAGDKFLYELNKSINEQRATSGTFIDFLLSNGIKAWHLHDGWVQEGYERVQDLRGKEINLTWIKEHEGHHSKQKPSIGDTIAIIPDLPSKDPLEKIDMYCYKIESESGLLYKKFNLKYLFLRRAIYNIYTQSFEMA